MSPDRQDRIVISAVLAAAVFGLSFSAGTPGPRQAPAPEPAACVEAFVVSAGEIELCNTVCRVRTKAGVREIWRGRNYALSCECAGEVRVYIDAQALGKGPQ